MKKRDSGTETSKSLGNHIHSQRPRERVIKKQKKKRKSEKEKLLEFFRLPISNFIHPHGKLRTLFYIKIEETLFSSESVILPKPNNIIDREQ